MHASHICSVLTLVFLVACRSLPSLGSLPFLCSTQFCSWLLALTMAGLQRHMMPRGVQALGPQAPLQPLGHLPPTMVTLRSNDEV